QQALELGADTFQFFTRNPRGGSAKALNLPDVKALIDFTHSHNFGPLIAHAPYTLNPSAAEPKTRNFALRTINDDLQRLSHFPGVLYNLHPGSHVGQGLEQGLKLTADLINQAITERTQVTVLLETMAGKGSEIGRTFGELAAILSAIEAQEKVGVCLDTCHVFDAGYDIKDDLDGVLEEFDRQIGLTRLKAIHVNDSLNALGSHKDRHAKIGQGKIGLDSILKIVHHPKLSSLPFVLETPNELPGYALEIKALR
ncbi:MAG: deoxyribonuclease IV, partial [Deltaproteobacteria bacterium]|nr:deoxyribonuclease IV [Deltaproteobacteria bacterium]